MNQNDEAGPPSEDGLSAGERERLANLGQRIETARIARQTRDNATGPGRPAGRPSDMAVAMRLSSELVAGVVVGAGIGWFLDWLTGLSPIFLVIFTGLGTVAGVMNVLRATRNMETGTARTGSETGVGTDTHGASLKDRQNGSDAVDK